MPGPLSPSVIFQIMIDSLPLRASHPSSPPKGSADRFLKKSRRLCSIPPLDAQIIARGGGQVNFLPLIGYFSRSVVDLIELNKAFPGHPGLRFSKARLKDLRCFFIPSGYVYFAPQGRAGPSKEPALSRIHNLDVATNPESLMAGRRHAPNLSGVTDQVNLFAACS